MFCRAVSCLFVVPVPKSTPRLSCFGAVVYSRGVGRRRGGGLGAAWRMNAFSTVVSMSTNSSPSSSSSHAFCWSGRNREPWLAAVPTDNFVFYIMYFVLYTTPVHCCIFIFLQHVTICQRKMMTVIVITRCRRQILHHLSFPLFFPSQLMSVFMSMWFDVMWCDVTRMILLGGVSPCGQATFICCCYCYSHKYTCVCMYNCCSSAVPQ